MERPLILGHRGAPLTAPENTMRGFALALARGADGVELDVQRTGDGVPVVIHDATLERTRHGEGAVSAIDWSRLSSLRGSGEPIPSLARVAAWAAETRAWLNVEIKATDVTSETLRVLDAAGILPRVILSSFHRDVIAEAARLDPAVTRYLLLDRWGAASMAEVRGCGAVGVCLRDDAASAEVVTELHSAGLPVIVWTVDDPERIAELTALGARGIITNRPELAGRGSGLA